MSNECRSMSSQLYGCCLLQAELVGEASPAVFEVAAATGVHHFACNVAGHCAAGQKIAFTIRAAPSAAPTIPLLTEETGTPMIDPLLTEETRTPTIDPLLTEETMGIPAGCVANNGLESKGCYIQLVNEPHLCWVSEETTAKDRDVEILGGDCIASHPHVSFVSFGNVHAWYRM